MPAAPLQPDYSCFSPLLAWVAAQGEVKRYKRGLILLQVGEPGGTLYFVLEGQLRAYATRDDGRELEFGTYRRGSTVGEIGLDGGPRSADVLVEKATVCSFVTRITLERCIRDRPPLAFELISLVADRARKASLQAAELALDRVYTRLVRWLQSAALRQADGTFCVSMPTQYGLARRLGCGRPMVTKLLGDLVTGGYLRMEQRSKQPVCIIVKPLPEAW